MHQGAFDGDAVRRGKFVQTLRTFIDGGHLRRGTFGAFDPMGNWYGCSIACALGAADVHDGFAPRSFGARHEELARWLNVSPQLIHIEDWVFENLLDDSQARAWPLRFYGRLLPGLDVRQAWPRISQQLDQVVPRQLARLLRKRARNAPVPDSAWEPYRALDGMGVPAAAAVGEAFLDVLAALAREQRAELGADAQSIARFSDLYGVDLDDFTRKVFQTAR